MNLQVKGVPALILLLMVGAVFGSRLLSAKDTLNAEARGQLVVWLQAQYAREYLPNIDVANPTSADADSILARSNVDIVSLTSRGRLDDTVVRAEISVNGGPPPDGKSVRYWHMEYSRLTGWRLRRETRAFAYYLKAF